MKLPLPIIAAAAPSLTSTTRRQLAELFRHDGALLRGLARFGARRAPTVLLRVVPPLCGVAFAALLPSLRSRTRANLRRVRGRRTLAGEAADVARTFAHFASCLTESMVLSRPLPPEIALEVVGKEHLEQARAQQRGAILVTAHTGGWEVAGPLLAKRFGIEILIAMRREPNAEARAIHDEARARSGVKVVHVDGQPLAVLPLFTHLRGGGVVGVQIDRALDPARALPTPLFGMPNRVPSGPFELARATGAPVIPVFARRRGYLSYGVSICAPIHVPRTASKEQLGELASRAVAEMEAFLSAHPTHWFDFGP